MHVELTNPGIQYTYGLPKIMTVEEAAEFLRVNVKTLYAAVESKDVPALKLGKRIVIPRVAFEQWFESAGNETPSADEIKRKPGRPPLKPEERRLPSVAFRPTHDLRKMLEDAAANSGRSLSQEIDRRLERSFLIDAICGRG